MYVIIWRFQVAPEQRAEFTRRYTSDGDWAALFRRSTEYLGTDLIVKEGEPGVFLTIDRWNSVEAWERFRTTFGAEYQELDHQCEGLTLKEEKLGAGVPV